MMPVKGLQKGVFLDRMTVDAQDLDFAQLDAVLAFEYFPLTGKDQLFERLQQADVAMTNKTLLDADALRESRLKLICVAATGTNNVDLQTAEQLGIAVCNVRAYATASVVQHVFALLLNLQTRLQDVDHAVREGQWSRSPYFCLLDFPVNELAGQTLGIVGYGELGQGVARIAEAFGMRVMIARRDADDDRLGRIDLHEMLPQVDVLSLHCPLTETTRGLIGGKELALMKSSAFLINTARGAIVDQAALLEALDNNQIAAAGIDVLDPEPPPVDHPLLTAQPKNLLITPHVAWASRQARQRVIDEIAQNIAAFMRGEKRNRVV
jgi:glycerate dehydrogenase